MNRKGFFEEVKSNIEKYLPEDLQGGVIDITKITKHNDTVFHGLTIRKENEAVAPNLYLEEYFGEYENGKDLETIMKDLVRDYEKANSVKKPVIKEIDFDFDKLSSNIVFQIVDMDKNKERLKDLAYKPIGNGFAMTYAVVFNDFAGGEGRCSITRDLISKNDWDLVKVDKAAMENTPKEYKATLINMTSAYFDFNQANLLEQKTEQLISEGMFVLSNDKCINGAATLFYPGIKEKAAIILGGDYFVLPSSIHECILLPDNGMHMAKELGAMVRDANRTVVAPQEILSDKVYHYDSKEQQLTTVFGEKERKREEAR